MSHVILVVCLMGSLWLIRRDTVTRPGVSAAVWIPTLWLGVIASRPVSLWLGLGGADTLEGSPADRLFFFGLIVVSLIVLSRRNVPWSSLLARNWPLVLFYGFLLVSVVWANSPVASFKRWIKETGNILVVLVLLTEPQPLQAIRAVFVRCAYLLIPLSIVYLRYFPELGRRYSIYSGQLEVTGVTTQKNSLGTLVLVCALIFLWDWLERSRPGGLRIPRIDRWATAVIFGCGLHLLYLSDSKTSIVCLGLATFIIVSIRLPLLQRRISALGLYGLTAILAFFLLDWVFGLKDNVVSSLGRDLTFTGRTDVWRELLAVGTDPFLGTGFMSFWDDAYYRSKLPPWVAFSAHNGYLEVYLAAGFVGVALLGLLLFVTALRLNRALATAEPYAVVRFAILVVALIANLSESNFACMTPIGFLFLLATIGQAKFATAPLAEPWMSTYPLSYDSRAPLPS